LPTLANVSPDGGEHLVDHLRLDREDQDRAPANQGVVVERHLDPVLHRQLLEAVLAHVARQDAPRLHDPGLEQASNERTRHVPGAEEADGAELFPAGVGVSGSARSLVLEHGHP
jgi:hypothetical protein